MILRLCICILLSVGSSALMALELGDYRLVDLSHSYGSDTLFWPTSPTKFEKKELAFGKTEGGYFYSAYSFCTPEHGGTHLDAPLHFSAAGKPTDKIPLEQLVAPGVVIDVMARAQADRNYRLSEADIAAFEREHGRIAPGTIVLLRTGWSRYWPDARAYLGDDTPGDASKLEFPSYGVDAARSIAKKDSIEKEARFGQAL